MPDLRVTHRHPPGADGRDDPAGGRTHIRDRALFGLADQVTVRSGGAQVPVSARTLVRDITVCDSTGSFRGIGRGGE